MEIGDTGDHDPIRHIRSHLGIEGKDHQGAVCRGSDWRNGQSWKAQGLEHESKWIGNHHRLVKPNLHFALPDSLGGDHPRGGSVLGLEFVGLVEHMCATQSLGDHPHHDHCLTDKRRQWVEHDPQGVDCLDYAGRWPIEAGLELGTSDDIAAKEALAAREVREARAVEGEKVKGKKETKGGKG